jgi:cyanophycinase
VRRRRRSAAFLGWVVLALVACAAHANADGPLVLFGGGDRPPSALRRFVEWAGGREARLLVATWASSSPLESYGWLREDLEQLSPAAIEMAPLAPLGVAERARLLTSLQAATGVFLGGGDQGRIMDVLRDAELLRAFRERHRAGAAFGGTSAGLAAMSPIMITGEGDFTVIDAARVETREGLGLLPGVILDQHFLRRRRQNRLFALVLAHPDQLGVGVDEDAALLVEDGRRAEAVGGPTMIVDGREQPGALVVRLLQPGQRYDLRERRVEPAVPLGETNQ